MYSILTLVFLACTIGAWASFTDSVRRSAWYVPLMAVVSLATGLLFAYGSRMLDDKGRIFVFSLLYDCAMAVAYYVLPILFFGCALKNQTIAAAVLIAAGLIVLHWE